MHRCVREDPVHRLRGRKRIHRPPVEAPSVALEVDLAAGAVFVLRSHGTAAAASPRSWGPSVACWRVLGVFFGFERSSFAVHLGAHSRLGELSGHGELLLDELLRRWDEAFPHRYLPSS